MYVFLFHIDIPINIIKTLTVIQMCVSIVDNIYIDVCYFILNRYTDKHLPMNIINTRFCVF